LKIPQPRVGLVIRYSFLWSHEVRNGGVEGRKDRPAAIIVATRKDEYGDIRVIVAPITHEPPSDPDASIEISPEVIRSLGLDGERHWLRIDELNRFSWPGFDIRPVPHHPDSCEYGMLPEALYRLLKASIIARQKIRAVRAIERD
jgi:hypothetical protein